MPDTTTLDSAALRAASRGQVIAPGDQGFDEARQAFNLMVDQRPAAIAIPADADDVAEVVRFAREHGLKVAPQRTGHNAGPLGSLADTLLVKTTALQDREIDREARRARVGGGVQWQDLVPQASEMGLAALHGSAPDIGIPGYTLGGGMGWYARKHGLASNSVTAIELVTGEGRQVRADHENESDLFWALRGGGGNFGVVTALEFELYPISEVYAGVLFFPFERASEVLHAWREWTDGAPEEVTSVGRVLQLPPIEEVPEFLRGQSFAVIEAACLMAEDDAAELLRPIRDLGPGMDTFAMVPPAGLAELHMDPPMPVPYLSTHELVDELSEKALDELLAVIGPGSGSPLLSVELRHTGGALARPEPDHGVLASVPGNFLAFGVSMTPEEPVARMVEEHLGKVSAALAPYACGRYLNFVEEAYDLRTVFGDEAYERLVAVKAEHDPDGIFRANHPISLTP
jgi:UDP-N-acetylenolpyruvoylglucosamine reductase